MSVADRAPVTALPEPAERVRLREAFAVTQAELADELNVTRRTVYAWEHGLSEPTGKPRGKYADILAAWARKESRLHTDIREAGDSIDVPPVLAKIRNRIT